MERNYFELTSELYTHDTLELDLFEKVYEVKLLTIKIQCPKCGHTWGVKIDDYDKIAHIPDRKFQCTNCVKE